jgi:hypothetical protein
MALIVIAFELTQPRRIQEMVRRIHPVQETPFFLRRQELRWSKTTAAEVMEMSYSGYIKLEAGTNKVIGYMQLAKAFKAFGVDCVVRQAQHMAKQEMVAADSVSRA